MHREAELLDFRARVPHKPQRRLGQRQDERRRQIAVCRHAQTRARGVKGDAGSRRHRHRVVIAQALRHSERQSQSRRGFARQCRRRLPRHLHARVKMLECRCPPEVVVAEARAAVDNIRHIVCVVGVERRGARHQNAKLAPVNAACDACQSAARKHREVRRGDDFHCRIVNRRGTARSHPYPKLHRSGLIRRRRKHIILAVIVRLRSVYGNAPTSRRRHCDSRRRIRRARRLVVRQQCQSKAPGRVHLQVRAVQCYVRSRMRGQTDKAEAAAVKYRLRQRRSHTGARAGYHRRHARHAQQCHPRRRPRVLRAAGDCYRAPLRQRARQPRNQTAVRAEIDSGGRRKNRQRRCPPSGIQQSQQRFFVFVVKQLFAADVAVDGDIRRGVGGEIMRSERQSRVFCFR